jgi:hypothetical protein
MKANVHTLALALASAVLPAILAVHPAEADDSAPLTHLQNPTCQATETWEDCFLRLMPKDLRAAANATAQEKLDAKTTPDATPDSASSLTSFLPRIVTALGFGDLSEEEGSQTLKFNLSPAPEGDKKPEQVTFELIRRDAEPLEAMIKAIPEAIRAERKTTLEEQVEDFDDVEGKVSVNFEGALGGWRIGRSFGLYEDLTDQVFTYFAPGNVNEPVQDLILLFDSLRQSGRFQEQEGLLDLGGNVGQARTEHPDETKELEAAVIASATNEWDNAEAFQNTLRDGGYFRLADLIHNQPQIHVLVRYRERDDRVGPSEWGLEATYEQGFGNINGLDDECTGDLFAPRVAASGDPVPCYQSYLDNRKGRIKSANRLSFSLGYAEADDLRFELPDDGFVFSLDEVRKTLGSAAYGRSLTVDAKGNDTSRLDVEAKYEDVSGDPMRNNRFVATTTFTQNLFDGNVVSLSVVYASEPEYRGEVDEELSARAGIKVKIDKKK